MRHKLDIKLLEIEEKLIINSVVYDTILYSLSFHFLYNNKLNLILPTGKDESRAIIPEFFGGLVEEYSDAECPFDVALDDFIYEM